MALASRAGANVCAAQREGDVLARMVSYAESNGYSYRIEEDKATERPGKFGKQKVPKVVFSRMDELFRLIGTTRPSRFIGRRFWEGKELPGKRNGDVGWATITKIELTTVGEVPGLSEEEFQQTAKEAKEVCLITRALAVVDDIELTASLKG